MSGGWRVPVRRRPLNCALPPTHSSDREGQLLRRDAQGVDPKTIVADLCLLYGNVPNYLGLRDDDPGRPQSSRDPHPS